jgi:hypothetical protein
MKAIVLACLLVCLLAFNPLEQLKAQAMQDVCVADALNEIKPIIDAKLAELKKDQKNLELEVEVLALMEQGKTMLDKCAVAKPQPTLGDAVEWEGVSFLLASNCAKDVGIVLLLSDTVIQDPTDWTNDLIVGIFGYFLGKQGVKDCEQFYSFVV